MLTRLETVCDRLAGDEHTQRKPAGHALGHGHDVGLDPGLLDREQPPAAAEAALHLVDHQQDAVRIEDRAHALQVAVRQRDDPALADHRLDDERCHVVRGLVTDCVLDSLRACQRARSAAHAAPIWIRHRRERNAGNAAAAALLALRVAGYGQRAGSASVKRRLQRDHLAATGVRARQAQRALHRLRAAAAEERLLQPARGHRRQPLREQPHHGHVVDVGAAVHQPVDLLLRSGDHARVHVAGVDHRDPGVHVGVRVASVIGDSGAARVVDHHGFDARERTGHHEPAVPLLGVHGALLSRA